MENTIEIVNENLKRRIVELEKLLADYKDYLTKKYGQI